MPALVHSFAYLAVDDSVLRVKVVERLSTDAFKGRVGGPDHSCYPDWASMLHSGWYNKYLSASSHLLDC